MKSKGLLAIAAVLTVVAVGGIGFAAFTYNVNGQVNAASGSLTLVWTGFYNHGFAPANATYMTCAVGPGLSDPSVMYFNSTKMASGDSCFYNATVENSGTLPAQWVTICYTATSTNTYINWIDTLGGVSTPVISGNSGCGVISGLSIAAGASALYFAQGTWVNGPGASYSFAITITGHVGA